MLGEEGAGSVHVLRRLVRGREMRGEGSGFLTCQKGHILRPVDSPPGRGWIQLPCSSGAAHHCEKPGQLLRDAVASHLQ